MQLFQIFSATKTCHTYESLAFFSRVSRVFDLNFKKKKKNEKSKKKNIYTVKTFWNKKKIEINAKSKHNHAWNYRADARISVSYT